MVAALPRCGSDEHMAAPTKGCDVKIPLANPEPSTHPKQTWNKA